MGVKTAKNHPQTPPVTLSVTSSPETYDYHENDNVSFPLSLDTTPQRSHLLGVMRPVWLKTTESEERLSLKKKKI